MPGGSSRLARRGARPQPPVGGDSVTPGQPDAATARVPRHSRCARRGAVPIARPVGRLRWIARYYAPPGQVVAPRSAGVAQRGRYAFPGPPHAAGVPPSAPASTP